jgi:hypothetical protein
MTNVPQGHRRIIATGALATLLAAVVAGPVASALAGVRPALQPHKTLTCSTVTASEIDKLVHLVVASPSSHVADGITTCNYNGKSSKVLIQYFQPWSSSAFTSQVSDETKHGETAIALSGYGTRADAISVVGIPAGIVVLQGSVGLIVSTDSLPDEKAIVKYLLPNL